MSVQKRPPCCPMFWDETDAADFPTKDMMGGDDDWANVDTERSKITGLSQETTARHFVG